MDLPNRITFRPQSRQEALLRAAGLEDILEGGEPKRALADAIGYGGAGFGGKTYGLLGLAEVACTALPGFQFTIFRRTLKEMEGPDGVISKSHELFEGKGVFNGTKKQWSLENGSSIYLYHAQYEADLYKFQGHSTDAIGFDEAQHFPWSMVDYLLGWLRATREHGFDYRPFPVFMFNPGGVGHGWLTQLFGIRGRLYDDHAEHEQVRKMMNPNGVEQEVFFIPAFIEDNQAGLDRDPEYEDRLLQRDPKLAQALRYGDFSVFAGQAFEEFEYDRHTCDPFDIPEHWPVWRAIDEGYTAPWVCLWFTQDPESERLYIYREAYQAGRTIKEQSEMIRRESRRSEFIGTWLRGLTWADPAMWAKKTVEDIVTSTADQYIKYGIPLERADNARVAGKRKVHEMLRNKLDGRPGMIIFRTCANLIRTLPVLPLDDSNLEDVDTKAEDHAYDALRYGLTSLVKRPDQSKRKKVASPFAGLSG